MRSTNILGVIYCCKCCLLVPNFKTFSLLNCLCRYAEKGLRILAFPCNQFNKQEPGPNNEIKEFAKAHGAEYDIFSKIDVNGKTGDPLFVYLKSTKGGLFGDAIKWNFTKFLCNKEGVAVKRYAPTTSPNDIVKDIEKELSK